MTKTFGKMTKRICLLEFSIKYLKKLPAKETYYKYAWNGLKQRTMYSYWLFRGLLTVKLFRIHTHNKREAPGICTIPFKTIKRARTNNFNAKMDSEVWHLLDLDRFWKMA